MLAVPFRAQGGSMFARVAGRELPDWARELGADSLRYLPVESIAKAVDRPADELCRACITSRYPTPHGQKLYQIALANAKDEAAIDTNGSRTMRTYEAPRARA